MGKFKPKSLVEAFGGNPPNRGAINNALILGLAYSRENASKAMMTAGSSGWHRRNDMMFTAVPSRTTSFSKGLSGRSRSSDIFSSFMSSMFGTKALRNTGYVYMRPAVRSFGMFVPAPKPFGMAA